MVLHSTKESIKEGQISALALTETLLASLISLYILFRYGNISHIVFSAAMAPFLLMQTSRSMDVGISLADKVHRLMQRLCGRLVNKSHAVSLLIFFPLIISVVTISVVAIFITKVAAFLFGVVSRPVESLGNIPSNWRKITLFTDVTVLPELIPGIDELKENDPRAPVRFYSVQRRFEDFSKRWPWRVWLIAAFIAAPIFFPAFLYRLGLKSTALIWSPLVWAFKPIKSTDDPQVFAKGILELSIYKVARWYSLIILILAVGKIFLFIVWVRVAVYFNAIPFSDVIAAYLAPLSLPSWHITAFVNACLTWIIFFYAENYLHLVNSSGRALDGQASAFFRTTFVVRNVLSIFTAVCTLYITAQLALQVDWPAVNFILLPW